MSDTKTVYISIGNSDDKLTQAEWATYFSVTALAIRDYAERIHGQWVSEPASAWQNACWCVELTDAAARSVRASLAELAARFGQDSIAWAEATTEFIKAES